MIHAQPPPDRLNHIFSPVSSPYSFSCKRVPKDAEDQLEAASGAASATAKVHAVPYSVGRLCSQLYRYNPPLQEGFHRIDLLRSSSAPGNAADWMYQRRGIKYSYTIHLRDTGTVSSNAQRCTPHSPTLTHLISVRIFAATTVDPASWGRDLEDGRLSGKLHHHETTLTCTQISDVA